MTCKNVRRSSSDYIDHALSGDELREFERHLRACARCYLRVEELRKLQEILIGLELPSPPAHLKNLLDRRIEAENQKKFFVALKALCNELTYPFRQIEKRDILIGLAILPVTLLLFLAILIQIYIPPKSSSIDQIIDLTLPSREFSERLARANLAQRRAKQQIPLPLTPARMGNTYLVNFAQSTYDAPRDDSFAVMTFINKDGRATIEEVIEYPQDTALLKKFDSMITSVRFQPARYKSRAVDSYLILIFNKIIVFG